MLFQRGFTSATKKFCPTSKKIFPIYCMTLFPLLSSMRLNTLHRDALRKISSVYTLPNTFFHSPLLIRNCSGILGFTSATKKFCPTSKKIFPIYCMTLFPLLSSMRLNTLHRAALQTILSVYTLSFSGEPHCWKYFSPSANFRMIGP